MARLAGKVALITGSGTGIGRASARAMAVDHAAQGVQVNAIAPAATMTDRVRSRLEAGVPRILKMANRITIS